MGDENDAILRDGNIVINYIGKLKTKKKTYKIQYKHNNFVQIYSKDRYVSGIIDRSFKTIRFCNGDINIKIKYDYDINNGFILHYIPYYLNEQSKMFLRYL
jgi:hypothetical protein